MSAMPTMPTPPTDAPPPRGRAPWPEIDRLPADTALDIPTDLGWYAAAKTAFDYTAALALLPLALVLMAVAAVAVKLTSPGPVFYTQTRVGLNGRWYKIIKIRAADDVAPPERRERAEGARHVAPAHGTRARDARQVRHRPLADRVPALPGVGQHLGVDQKAVGARQHVTEYFAAENFQRAIAVADSRAEERAHEQVVAAGEEPAQARVLSVAAVADRDRGRQCVVGQQRQVGQSNCPSASVNATIGKRAAVNPVRSAAP